MIYDHQHSLGKDFEGGSRSLGPGETKETKD
jgi:hypothetical protein